MCILVFTKIVSATQEPQNPYFHPPSLPPPPGHNQKKINIKEFSCKCLIGRYRIRFIFDYIFVSCFFVSFFFCLDLVLFSTFFFKKKKKFFLSFYIHTVISQIASHLSIPNLKWSNGQVAAPRYPNP